MPSLWSRKRDLAYFGFFAIHIPIIFFPLRCSKLQTMSSTYGLTDAGWYDIFFSIVVDAVPVLPGLLDNALSRQLRDFYIATYRDKFFEGPVPAWFTSYTWMEILYHVPLSIWALGALLRDDPLVPVHMLVFGFQSFLTSWTCLCEVWAWEDRTVAEKQNLTTLYGPYVALGAFMTLDMFWRLRTGLLNKSKRE